MKIIYLVFALSFISPTIFAQESAKVIPWNEFSKRLPGNKTFKMKAFFQKISGSMKRFPIKKNTIMKLYQEAIIVVEQALKLKLKRRPKLVISDFVTGLQMQRKMDKLIRKSGITNVKEAEQFKYGQEAGIVPAAYLPSNIIVVYRDNIAVFSKLLAFNKRELKEVVKLALIHELIHAYQNQEIRGLDAAIDTNQNYLFICEGHATYITNQIAQQIGLIYTNRLGLSFFTYLKRIGEKYRLGLDYMVLYHIDQGHIQGSKFFKELRIKKRASLGMWDEFKKIINNKMVRPVFSIRYSKLLKKL